MNRLALAVVLALSIAAFGCDNNDAEPQTDNSSPVDAPTTTQSDPAVTLKAAVRDAVHQNSRLSEYVLWHNRLPRWASQSTRGRALHEIRKSIADRQKRRLRIKTLSRDVHVLGIRLDPSFTRASADVRQRGRVSLYRRGARLGRPLRLNEHAHVELRRLGSDDRFVVWEVRLAR